MPTVSLLLCLCLLLCHGLYAEADAAPTDQDGPAKKQTKVTKDRILPGKDQGLPQLYLPAMGELSSPFGLRRIPRGRGSKVHKGIDIKAESGTPVCAAAPGKVSFIGAKRGYGIVVEIEHDKGLMTRYAHLESSSAEMGSQVETGDPIGAVGRTGHTTGSNLHFETVLQGRCMDPMPFLDLEWKPQHFNRPSFLSSFVPGKFTRFTSSPSPSSDSLSRRSRLIKKRALAQDSAQNSVGERASLSSEKATD